MVKRITPNIRSGNPAIGQEFYTDILGLEVVTDMGGWSPLLRRKIQLRS
jgi:catechol 2,3-dioxygenase-like lactoylglutathione lyase family enzyme